MSGATTVHSTAVVAPNVRLGEGSIVGEYTVIERAPRGKKDGELELVIGPGAVIRPFTTIYAGTRIGARLQTGQGASIREDNVLGDDVSVGTHASLEFGNRVGSRVRIHTGCFLELTQIDDDVFLGPHVVFTDDPHPQCPAYLDCVRGGVVRRRARIGASCATRCHRARCGPETPRYSSKTTSAISRASSASTRMPTRGSGTFRSG